MAVFVHDTIGVLGLDKRTYDKIGNVTLDSAFWEALKTFPLSWIDFGDNESIGAINNATADPLRNKKVTVPHVVRSMRELYIQLDNASVDVIPVFGRMHINSKLFLYVLQSTDILMGPELRALKFQERNTSGVNLRDVFKQALRKRESTLKEQVAERFSTLSGSLSRAIYSTNSYK